MFLDFHGHGRLLAREQAAQRLLGLRVVHSLLDPDVPEVVVDSVVGYVVEDGLVGETGQGALVGVFAKI